MKQSDVKLVWITPDAEKNILYCARVSSNNQNSENTKLLNYCIKHGHWSIFEMANLCIEINTSRAISAQILRHRSFSFQEFCMSGDTEVYFDLPGAVKKGKRRLHKLTLKQLYDKWHKKDALGNDIRPRVQNMNVRVFDEKTKKFTHANIKEVFQTGVKDIFEIELENGKKIKSTKEHKVLTKNGFKSLEDAFGLELINNTAVISKNDFIGCNGVPIHQDFTWLSEAKNESLISGGGIDEISEKAEVSYHTIRKWLKVHNLQFTKKEIAQITEKRGGVWNKGKTGYSWGTHSKKTRKLMSQKARKGKDSNFWKGGVTPERQKIQCDISKFRVSLIEDYKGKCGFCNKKLDSQVDLHHIIPVSEDTSLAREYNNLMPAHRKCHMEHHGKNGDLKKWKEKGRGNQMTTKWSKIKKVTYVGKEMTYDLEIDHESHNYVANGVVVHNSQRYAKAQGFIEYDARRQDETNRQNSIDDMDESDHTWFQKAQQKIHQKSADLYQQALDKGIAKEQARFLLPMSTKSKLYMNGTVRSWMHYINLRCGNGTQLEHIQIADQCKKIFKEQMPIVAKALEW